MKLNVLVAGPQGSGKTTWAKLLFALTPHRLQRKFLSCTKCLAKRFCAHVGVRVKFPITASRHWPWLVEVAVSGPGVISRSARWRFDYGRIFGIPSAGARGDCASQWRVAMSIWRERVLVHVFPADFQLIATTNLCPCGKLNPEKKMDARWSLTRCRSTSERLSGPVMDRFDN